MHGESFDIKTIVDHAEAVMGRSFYSKDPDISSHKGETQSQSLKDPKKNVNFTSQSTTAALSIEIGSLFEGESEFEKLKIYLITLVSIRSDWEDLPWLFRSVENLNTMAEQNVPAQAPARTLIDFTRSQMISVDILRNTNFFRAFSASASVPAVYIQQFWNSMKYDEKTGVFSCFKLMINEMFMGGVYSGIQELSSSHKASHEATTVDVHKRLSLLSSSSSNKNLFLKKRDDPESTKLAKKMSLDAHQEKGEGEGVDADIERDIKLSLDPAFLPQGRAPVGGVTIGISILTKPTKLPEVVGKGKAIVTEEQVAHSLIDLSKKKRTTDQFILVRRDQAPHDSTTGPSSQPEDDTSEKVIHESSSTSDSERTESETEAAAPKGDKELGEVDSSTVSSGVSIPVSTQGQAGSDPEKAHEALAGPDPEPMQEDQTGSDSGKVHVSLAGPNPEHMDDEFLATAYPKVHENLKLITDERVIEDNPESHSGSMSSMKNLEDTDNFGDQFLYDKPTKDDQEKSKVVDESDSTIPDPSHQTVTSTPLVIALVTDFSSPKPSSLVTPPPINTEATTITTSLPEITPFIALQLRVARLEILERHTTDLIKKYSVLLGLESIKNQESEKSHKEIIIIKKEQGEEKQESTYSIKSTDKVALEEFDLKSALFKHMNKNKTANRNPANYHLYHALMEALIADEDAMDKEVKDRVKNHKRKHDSDDDEDDDDDEGPSAGSNQGKSSKRRRHDSGASGSAQPPTKDDEQSSKKPRESDASASKQHPALTSTGWQITDTRDAVVDSSMHRSDPESEHSEQSSDDIPMQDEGHVSDLEDTDNAHIPKVSTTTWFKPIPEGERPATPEPEWTIPPNDFPEPENNWANTYATTYQVPAENKLQRKTYDIGSFIKWFCRRTGKKSSAKLI
ncbi:hypothetical protein Tco_1467328 [Tanacetum coccineum]